MQLSSRFVQWQQRLRGSLLNSLIVMGGYVLSRITGLLRDIVISAQFGTSGELGAYYAAFRVTDLLYMIIIGGALGSSFIPVFIQVWDRDGAERAWRVASAVVMWALTLLAVASAILWLMAPLLTLWLYVGFDAHHLALTTRLIRLFLLSPLLLGLGGLAMAALNARNHFTLPALAPALYNVGIMAGALFFAPRYGIWALAWGVVAGALCYVVVQLPGVWHMGMRFSATYGTTLPELGTIGKHMAPRVVGQAAAQVSLLVTAMLAARLIAGAERIAGLNYAYQLMLLPYGIFSLSLSTVAFPQLARLFAEGKHHELYQRVRQTMSTIVFLTLPATVALIALAIPLVRLLFQRGEFGTTSLVYTVIPLCGYATALPAFAVSEILIRTFYAMQQTRIPVLVGLLQVSINLILGSIAVAFGGDVGWLALAFSIANNIEMMLLFVLLGRQLPGVWRDGALWRGVRAVLWATNGLALVLWAMAWGTYVMGWVPSLHLAAPYAWQHDGMAVVVWLTTVSVIGGGMYAAMATLAGSHEIKRLWQTLQ